mmetsp:Transcript_18883/g.48446  ORF Transcript_18883/g.48446 Transcript_18883/m.48446 type:complete len:141 (+) Transcript_18883:3-425(+)
MMAYLAAKDETFEHVIAMDANFMTFTRAWVVAEVAQGHDVGLRQHLKLRRAADLQAYRSELMSLDVRKMRASRPEDIVEILDAIPDKDAFNKHLHSMIFDEHSGLLALWEGQDTIDKMDAAGRIAWLMEMSSCDPRILKD